MHGMSLSCESFEDHFTVLAQKAESRKKKTQQT
jgi:hypothetical protein